jgi:phosphotriesterase-related protein
MGVTYSHEHLLMKPSDRPEHAVYTFDEPDKLVEELADFAAAGGGTIVEMTPLNFGRDVAGYRDIARRSGVHVIFATGFHKEEFVPAWVQTATDTEIVERLLDEIERGVGDTGARPGVIKVGSSYNTITPTEKRLMAIIAEVHRRSSLPISTHCDKGTMALQQSELLLAYDVNPGRVLLGHVDIPVDSEYLHRICELGFNVSIDHVGRELGTGDAARIQLMSELIDAGFRDHIYLSGDMGKRSYLRSYGGEPGLDYILTTLRENMLASGIPAEDIEHILVANPQRLFCVPL